MESIGTIVPYLKSGFRHFVYVIVFFLIAAEALASDRPVTVKAMIVDARSGETLIGAAMLLEGTAEGAVTDIDGFCEIQLDKGTHVLSVSYIGYLSAKVSLEIDRSGYSLGSHEANVTRDDNILKIALTPDEKVLDDAVVTARKSLESLRALQNERVASGFAIENMGAREMSLKGISNAQESVAKLSGISIADAGQLIVRGLGDRYSTTTLNGLPIASPNPDNKLIPLDLFPASAIQNITVSKVYEAGSFADYSGAHIDISTKEGKSEDFLNLSFSTGGLFPTVFRTMYMMDGQSLFVIPRVGKDVDGIPHSEFGDYVKEHEIFKSGFSTHSKTALPDLNGSFVWGKNFMLGSNELALLAAAGIKSGSENIYDAFYKTYEASREGNLMSEYNYDSYTDKLDITSLADLKYSYRDSDDLSFTFFFARNAKNTHLDRKGYNFLETYDLTGVNQVLHYYTLQNYQLSGHNELAESWQMDWGLSQGLTYSDEPDRRQVMFRRNDAGELKFFDLNNQETQRFFGYLSEMESTADVKTAYGFDSDMNRKIRFGLTAKYKTRDYQATRYYYNLKQLDETVDDVYDLDGYLGQENISSDLITLERKMSRRDRYDAANMTAAAFAEIDYEFSPKWFINAGLRFEAVRQTVSYNDDVADQVRNLDSYDLFPAVNLKYSLRERNMLRFSVSRTVTRPSFIEMAPFLYQESYGGAQIRGNENLENGYNYNADLKYELFSSINDDMLAVTAYYKYLASPIERTQRVSGGATEHSFQNAEDGMAAGLEVEFRKQLVRNLNAGGNLSYMYTDVKLPEGGVYTNTQRSLQGASPYLVNLDLTYTPEFNDGSSLGLALLYNVQGPRIHAVGIMGLGDVIQKPLHTLDFSASFSFAGNWKLQLSIDNLLDSEFKFVQEIPQADRTVDVERWKLGRGAMIGIVYSL